MRAALLTRLPDLMLRFPSLSYLNVDEHSTAELDQMARAVGIDLFGGE